MSKTKPNTSRNDLLTADQLLIDGTQKNASKLPQSMTVGSKTVTQADIIAVILGRITAGKAAQAAEAARTAAVKAERDARAQTRQFVTSYRRVLMGMFSESPETLAMFGLHPLVTGRKTAAAKADAASKAVATRKVNHPKAQKGVQPPAPPPAQNDGGGSGQKQA
jgi:hypothetical protein